MSHEEFNRAWSRLGWACLGALALWLLVGLLTPIRMGPRRDALKFGCSKKLSAIAKAIMIYQDQYGAYPSPMSITSGASAQDRSLAVFESLWRAGLVEDPSVFCCENGKETPADPDGPRHLTREHCSFVIRLDLKMNADSHSPLVADRWDPEHPNHPDGVNVCFVGSNVMWFPNEKVLNPTDREAIRLRRELPGFPDVPAK